VSDLLGVVHVDAFVALNRHRPQCGNCELKSWSIIRSFERKGSNVISVICNRLTMEHGLGQHLTVVCFVEVGARQLCHMCKE
jgi:hypothetical protein